MKAHRLAKLANQVANPQPIEEASVLDKLTKVGIKTMVDLDAYIKKHPLPNGHLESRYHTLKKLVGEQAADKIMQELMVQSWKIGKKGMGEEVENLDEATWKIPNSNFPAGRGSPIRPMNWAGDWNLKGKKSNASDNQDAQEPAKEPAKSGPRFALMDRNTKKILAVGSKREIVDRYWTDSRKYRWAPANKPDHIVGNVYKESIENVQEVAPAQVEATDPDGEMALTQIKNVADKAAALMEMIQPNSKLEPWVQSKITLADDYITTIHDYLKNTPGAIGNG